METNAISVANYLIGRAVSEGFELRQYGLMKHVYLVHGYSLACFDKPALDPHCDVVEDWKHCPVMPSVYHNV